MYSNLFSPESIEELTAALQTQFLSAIWETFYVTLLSTAFAIVIGLPLGVHLPEVAEVTEPGVVDQCINGDILL